MVDNDGRAPVLQAQLASVQDGDRAVPVLKLSLRAFPFVTKAFVDAGYAGERPKTATLWKNPEATLASGNAVLYAATVMILTRRLARLWLL